MTYRTKGNGSSTTLKATRADAVVRELRRTSMGFAAETEQEFMEGAARRAWVATGHKVRTDTAAVFVADLVAAGLLVEGS